MKSLTNSFLLTLRRALQSRFGYVVQAHTDSFNVFVHYSWTLADALAWASCYPANDNVAIWQANLRSQVLVTARRNREW